MSQHLLLKHVYIPAHRKRIAIIVKTCGNAMIDRTHWKIRNAWDSAVLGLNIASMCANQAQRIPLEGVQLPLLSISPYVFYSCDIGWQI